MNIERMKAEIKDLLKKLGDMKAQCETERREPSDEEIAESRACIDRIRHLEKLITLEEDIQNTNDRLTRTTPAQTREQGTQVPDRTPPGQTRTADKFTSFGEFLAAVVRAAQPDGSIIDPRLTMRAAQGLSEGISSDGGYLVQTDFAAGLIQNVWQNGIIPSRITKYTVSTNANGLKINGVDETSRAAGSRSGGILMYWLSEAASKTASKPKFRQIELNLKKLIGLCYATDELLQDAAALEGVVRQGFQNEMDFMISDSIINGTGAGQPLGIMNSGCLVTVAKETGQPAATLQVENIIKMWSRMLPASQGNAIWLINNDCFPQLYTMGLSVGTGGVPIFMPAGGVSSAPYSTILGRPIIPIEQCQTIGTTGDIILADLSQYIGIDKGGMTSDVSIHVRFVYDESVFRFVYRFDGQPNLRAAITPYKGSSNTLSPFVCLATRA